MLRKKKQRRIGHTFANLYEAAYFQENVYVIFICIETWPLFWSMMILLFSVHFIQCDIVVVFVVGIVRVFVSLCCFLHLCLRIFYLSRSLVIYNKRLFVVLIMVAILIIVVDSNCSLCYIKNWSIRCCYVFFFLLLTFISSSQ